MNEQNTKKINALLLHEDPINEIRQNVYSNRNYTASDRYHQLFKLRAKSGFGKLMKIIYENPGCTRDQIREIGGYRGHCAEAFTTMKAACVTKNVRGQGYFLTELGEALLAINNLI